MFSHVHNNLWVDRADSVRQYDYLYILSRKVEEGAEFLSSIKDSIVRFLYNRKCQKSHQPLAWSRHLWVYFEIMPIKNSDIKLACLLQKDVDDQ